MVTALLSPLASQAAISVSGTRVIYEESSNETPLTVRNTADGSIYLIRSWIDKEGNQSAPFTITPPLFRIDSGQENAIRITKTDTSSLPQDRESLFWLNIMAIPPESDKKDSKLQFSLNTRIKLLFRPDSINNKNQAQNAWEQLTFSRTSSGMKLKNPTPYYINIFSMKFDGVMVKEKAITIPPMGDKVVVGTTGTRMTWSAINDYGGITKEMTRNL